MEKILCTLEFKEGRPVAKEIGKVEIPIHYDLWAKYGDYTQYGKALTRECLEYKDAENSRSEFEIDPKCHQYDWGLNIFIAAISFGSKAGRFTATIENNIVTKIELL